MRVACWCGCVFNAQGQLAECPYCATPAVLPSLTYRDLTEMACDLAEILAEHEPERSSAA